MRIKEVYAKSILDSKKERTIQVFIKTEQGLFSCSSPSGKSKGKHEKKSYMGGIENDIKKIESLDIHKLKIERFSDLSKVEKLIGEKIGANSLFSLETCMLKALAAERKEKLWQLINPKAKTVPFPVGNCIGGGLHSNEKKKPDFQEFLIIPKTENFSDNVFLMKQAYDLCKKELEARKVKIGRSDENAWSTSLSNEQVLEIMQKVKEELAEQTGKRIEIGVDIAASTFYTGLVYHYKNKEKRLTKQQQINYVLDLIDKYNLDYIEDPLCEEDFSGFNKIRYKAVRIRPTSLIVGDDLIVSQAIRLKKALKERSVNGIILKPNQVGSLLELARVVKLAREEGIKTVMSHRSGETEDYSLADLAFGFQTDYIKTGIIGEEREVKLRRLIEISEI